MCAQLRIQHQHPFPSPTAIRRTRYEQSKVDVKTIDCIVRTVIAMHEHQQQLCMTRPFPPFYRQRQGQATPCLEDQAQHAGGASGDSAEDIVEVMDMTQDRPSFFPRHPIAPRPQQSNGLRGAPAGGRRAGTGPELVFSDVLRSPRLELPAREGAEGGAVNRGGPEGGGRGGGGGGGAPRPLPITAESSRGARPAARSSSVVPDSLR